MVIRMGALDWRISCLTDLRYDGRVAGFWLQHQQSSVVSAPMGDVAPHSSIPAPPIPVREKATEVPEVGERGHGRKGAAGCALASTSSSRRMGKEAHCSVAVRALVFFTVLRRMRLCVASARGGSG